MACCRQFLTAAPADEPTLHITNNGRSLYLGTSARKSSNLVSGQFKAPLHGPLCNPWAREHRSPAHFRDSLNHRLRGAHGLTGAALFIEQKSAQHNAPGTDQERIICDKFKKLFNHFASDLKKFERQYTPNVALSAANR